MSVGGILGIVFSDLQNESKISEINSYRTFAALPFGGKYRLIDFPLSNAVNSGIDTIGVVVKNNYNSLIDHLGSGKCWGLSRRRGGLTILPPYLNSADVYGDYLQTLYLIRDYIKNSSESYVLLTDCDAIYNINYNEMLEQHIKRNADISVLYKVGEIPKSLYEPLKLKVSGNERIDEIRILYNHTEDGETSFALNTTLIKKDLLLDLISDCVSRNKLSFKRDILQSNVGKLNICGYKFDGFCAFVNDIESFFSANMSLMDTNVQYELFGRKTPIYTTVRDDMPAKYGLGSCVKNSLIAQGSVIDGEVKNSVISNGVKIGKGSTITNCVLMQDTVIGENCNLSYVICDKDCVVSDNSQINGIKTYPIYVTKKSVI